ncbi:MAG: bifunctional DNA-formamidopyrimidine glycosylase/DNA-(apurinic or apyrimidinic site) lyase [Clostridia bacterium]|nr:bifunctional DNA-formamidopyrimidine glycosylase/DNA-(apurinic or apyrimidinic site) lyase [Clostridia bacterium]MDD4798021.1 bifunctional DNA-formamidopyrimidine glycosylase/DNA-(apurinic or apyrimidinic site) lyase [Clostridia bacterium]
MPELPEVETIKRTLSNSLTDKTIVKIDILRPSLIKFPLAEDFSQQITGEKIISLGRRGKYLSLNLASGAELVVHLRMTGRLIFTEQTEEKLPHTHIIMALDDGNELRYSDVRRFGCLWLLPPQAEDKVTGRAKLGPEPLSEQFNAEALLQILTGRKISIKQALLDQSVVAGLGNIYVDETLFAAGLLPMRCVSDLRREDFIRLAEVIPPILQSSIEHCGTTFSDYLDGQGNRGGNIAYLKVYGREGQPCPVCGTILKKQRVAGRSSVYCPVCQK